jgi:ABC-type Na+ efflux pump permease subunit
MALLSILLAVVAFGCTIIGFLTTPIPVVGLVFSFGAAAIALAGAMLGGRAISQAKQRALPTDAGRIAVVFNVLAFVPALLVAFTCGVCNAIVSSGNIQVQKRVDFGVGPGTRPDFGDAGAAPLAPSDPAGKAQPPTAAPAEPDTAPAPGKMPPPPLPAGPRK